MEHYQKAFQIRPSMDIQHNMGNVLLKQGKYDEAIELYQQIMPEIPDTDERAIFTPAKYSKGYEILKIYIEGHVNLAFALEHKGRFDEAIKHYNEVLRVAPTLTRARQSLAGISLKQKKYEEAIRHYKELLRANQVSAEIFTNLAIALFHMNRFDDAAMCFNNAIKIVSNNPVPYYYLGEIFSMKGNIDNAIENYRKALSLSPDWATLKDKLAWHLATYNKSKYHDPAQAVRLAQQVCEQVNYKYPEVLNTLAIAYAADGKFTQATETASKAIELAETAGKGKLAREIRERLELYKNEKTHYSPLPGDNK